MDRSPTSPGASATSAPSALISSAASSAAPGRSLSTMRAPALRQGNCLCASQARASTGDDRNAAVKGRRVTPILVDAQGGLGADGHGALHAIAVLVGHRRVLDLQEVVVIDEEHIGCHCLAQGVGLTYIEVDLDLCHREIRSSLQDGRTRTCSILSQRRLWVRSSHFGCRKGHTMKSFTDRIAVVTGAGSGIGRATSEALAQKGERARHQRARAGDR